MRSCFCKQVFSFYVDDVDDNDNDDDDGNDDDDDDDDKIVVHGMTLSRI